MLTFANPVLLWGLALLGVPVLIHLINMMRHRRMAWAAMEFLLESQRKSRRWVTLRQILLLSLRLAAIAALVLIVARPRLPSTLGAALGTGKVHHVVLLDDSFSMTERRGDTTPFDRAVAAIDRIGRDASQQQMTATFTLLRFSRAGNDQQTARPDMVEQLVGPDFPVELEAALGNLAPTQLDSSPGEALAALERLFGPPEGEQRVVYLVSDYRTRQWQQPDELKKLLEQHNRQGSQIHLVSCAPQAEPNLTITSLAPMPGTRAAGVPWFMEVSVHNYSTETARDVAVTLEQDGQPRPGLTIDVIPPGKTETRRFAVQFATAGEHRIAARLPGDAVSADNSRFAVVDVPLSVPVLVIDGDLAQTDARFLSAALAPGGTSQTGITVRTEPPTFLANRPLDEYSAILLANFERLEPQAIQSLEHYVAAGGGVAFFLGPQSRAGFINERLYRDGEGLFPAPLDGPTELPVNTARRTPDLEVTDHPIFRVFAGERNSFLSLVNVDRYFAVSRGWEPPQDSAIRVLARLRGGAPLAIENTFGEGRVVALTTTAAPTWNNWAQNPSFVVAMLELQGYLASARGSEPPRRVGTPLVLQLDPAVYQPAVRYVLPDRDGQRVVRGDAVHRDGSLVASLPSTERSGFYEVELATLDGGVETRRFAFNVVPEEGNLAIVSSAHLAESLDGISYEYHRADAAQIGSTELAGFDLSQSLLFLLVGLLLGEQFVAYLASYHPKPKGGVR